jgi:hypothetical protein
MESLNVLISTNMINSMVEFFTYEISSKEERKFFQTNNIELNIPSPAKSISQYKPLLHRKSSSKSITDDQSISS